MEARQETNQERMAHKLYAKAQEMGFTEEAINQAVIETNMGLKTFHAVLVFCHLAVKSGKSLGFITNLFKNIRASGVLDMYMARALFTDLGVPLPTQMNLPAENLDLWCDAITADRALDLVEEYLTNQGEVPERLGRYFRALDMLVVHSSAPRNMREAIKASTQGVVLTSDAQATWSATIISAIVRMCSMASSLDKEVGADEARTGICLALTVAQKVGGQETLTTLFEALLKITVHIIQHLHHMDTADPENTDPPEAVRLAVASFLGATIDAIDDGDKTSEGTRDVLCSLLKAMDKVATRDLEYRIGIQGKMSDLGCPQ